MAAVAAATTLLVGEVAARADDREQCATAADQAQQLRDEGKYRRAREQLLVCARNACPAPIKRDCLEWLTQVESISPTVVFAAKEGTKDLSEVKVSVDGAPVTDRLDGKPVQMDLGKHTVKFEYQGQTKEEEVVIGAGQKNRSVTVTFGATTSEPVGPTPPPPAPAKEQRSLVPVVILGGIGVVALGSFAFFGLSGKSDVSDLEAENCKPHCSQDRVDKARSKLIIADVSLGIGIVSLGVATILILTRPKVDAEVKTDKPAATQKKPTTGLGNVTFDVGALSGGAMGAVGGRF